MALGIPSGWTAPSASLQAPAPYEAHSDLRVYPEPPLPALGPAGFVFRDPTFGSRILRVTDPQTLGSLDSLRNVFFATPLYGELNAWNADGTLFYIESPDLLLPFKFDRRRMAASRVVDPSSRDGKLAIRAEQDATFSYNAPDLLYLKDHGKIKTYTFYSRQFREVLDLNTIRADTRWLGPLSISADEKLCVCWGGSARDTNSLVLVYDVRRKTRHVLDTEASTIDGQAISTGQRLGWFTHYAWIDKSGRYVVVMATGNYQLYVWDLGQNAVRKMEAYGHSRNTLGYGLMINDARPTNDAGPQWMLRSLDPLGMNNPRALMPAHGPPPFLSQSTLAWNLARPDRLEPVVITTFSNARNPSPPMPLVNEIFALATDGSGRVRRYAHHRSLYRGDWWDMPKGNLSQGGRYFLFTSNWENSLGAGRRDVFLLELVDASRGTQP